MVSVSPPSNFHSLFFFEVIMELDFMKFPGKTREPILGRVKTSPFNEKAPTYKFKSEPAFLRKSQIDKVKQFK